MDINFRGRHTDVLERFRQHAMAKLSKIGKLDQKAIRVDLEVSTERNPRQSTRRERVELTISSRGPTIRAEAAAEDRYAALDLALAKLDSRLRRAGDRRKGRHGARAAVRLSDLPTAAEATLPGASAPPAEAMTPAPPAEAAPAPPAEAMTPAPPAEGEAVIPIETDGNGPLVVREKFHRAVPMSVGEALFEMELVGHDFFLFRDVDSGHPSVVYRRRGYQYGVIRLVEATPQDRANGQARTSARAAAG